MPKYRVNFTEQEHCHIEIEADTEEDARELFWSGEFDPEKVIRTGGEVSAYIHIERGETP